MEKQYNLKIKNKKWIIGIVALSVILCTMLSVGAVKYYNHIKEEKGIEPIDEAWGLGKTVTESVSNNRDYEWYVDQKDRPEDCVPAVFEMVLKWVNENSQLKIDDIRRKLNENYLTNKGSDIFDFLKENNVSLKFMEEENDYEAHFKNGASIENIQEMLKEDFKENIKKGKICIILCDMKNISYNLDKEKRYSKTINTASNHWIILKGYKVVDKKLYFEVYDPMSLDQIYEDGTLIGKNRYYLADEVVKGTTLGCYIEKSN